MKSAVAGPIASSTGITIAVSAAAALPPSEASSISAQNRDIVVPARAARLQTGRVLWKRRNGCVGADGGSIRDDRPGQNRHPLPDLDMRPDSHVVVDH